MMERPYFTIAGMAVIVLATLAWPSIGEADWKERLQSAEDPMTVWSQAVRAREKEALASALTELDDEALPASGKLVKRLIPGGDLAAHSSEELQVKLVGLLPKALGDPKAAGYHLWKIAQLSPRDELRTAALETLKNLPEEALPAGYVEMTSEETGDAINPAKMARGKEVYMRPAVCFTCHQPNGEGIPLAFPPLAGSEWLDGNTERLVKIVLKGLMGEITVKGETYNNVMLPLELMLKDDEIADVLTYVRNSWGNQQPEVTADQVAAIREMTKDRTTPYQVSEILEAHPLSTE